MGQLRAWHGAFQPAVVRHDLPDADDGRGPPVLEEGLEVDLELVDDGALRLIDFTQRFDRASTFVERVYKAWFGLDGVYFNRDQVDYVAARTAPEYYAEARSRVPYTPWYPTRYLFAGRKEA